MSEMCAHICPVEDRRQHGGRQTWQNYNRRALVARRVGHSEGQDTVEEHCGSLVSHWG